MMSYEPEPLELLKWGMWVHKIPNIPRGSEPPATLNHWGRYFMWMNKGTIYYGEEEGKPSCDIPVASCRSADRFDPVEFSQKKGAGAPSMLTDFAWILKTVEFSTIFVSDSEQQCQSWVDGINSMLPGHLQREASTSPSSATAFAASGRRESIMMGSNSVYGAPPAAAAHHQRSASHLGSGGYPSGSQYAHEDELFTADARAVLQQQRSGGAYPPQQQQYPPQQQQYPPQHHQYPATVGSRLGGLNETHRAPQQQLSIVTSPLTPGLGVGSDRPTPTYASFDAPNNSRGGSAAGGGQLTTRYEEERRASAAFGAGGGALVVQGHQQQNYHSDPYHSGSMRGGTSSALSPYNAHANGNTSNLQVMEREDALREEAARRRFAATEELRRAEEATDIVAMGTWVQKVKGDEADGERNKKFSSNVEWQTRWMWMEGLRSASNGSGISSVGVGSMGSGLGGAGAGTILFYGAQKGKKEKQIHIDKCISVERLSDEEMYSFKAPAHLYRFGLRLVAPNGKNWVFACESELEALGWYSVWRKIIPLSAAELARQVQQGHEEVANQQDYFNEKHRLAEAQRRREAEAKKALEEERQREIEARAAEMAMAQSTAASAEAERQRAAAAEAQQQQLALQQQFQLMIQQKQAAERDRAAAQSSQQETMRAFQQEMQRQIDAKAREEKMLAEIEANHKKKLEEQRKADAEEAERRVNEVVERKMLEAKLKAYEEEEARRKKAAEDAEREEAERKRREAEKKRLQEELEEDERRMAEAHAEAMAKKKKDTGCCVIS